MDRLLVLVLVITSKGTACIPDQHKINAIIKLAIQKYMKKAGRKYPDRLADSCKRSSVNRMAAGSRLSSCILDFFSCLQLFKHTVLTYIPSLAGCRTYRPSALVL